jgi:hypothetical protein
MKVPGVKRYGIGIIAEFCGIPTRFLNQAHVHHTKMGLIIIAYIDE